MAQRPAWPHPEGLASGSQAAQEGKLLGARHGAPLGLLASVCLRLLLIFQAKVRCWFLSPLVPTFPGTYLLT